MPRSLAATSSLTQTGGIFSLAADSTFSGDYNLNGGTLSNGGNLTMNPGTLNFGGGTLSGGALTAAGGGDVIFSANSALDGVTLNSDVVITCSTLT